MATYIEAKGSDDNAEPSILSAGTMDFSILPNLSTADAKVGVSPSNVAPWETALCHHAEPGEFAWSS